MSDELERRTIAGLDVGKQRDYSAFAVLDAWRKAAPVGGVRIVEQPGVGRVTEVSTARLLSDLRTPRELLWNYQLTVLKRWETGTDYTLISERLAKWYCRALDDGGLAGTTMALDFTGVGGPMCDIIARDMRLRGAKVRIVPINIGAGSKVTVREDRSGGFNVPKKELVSVLHVLMGGGDKKRLRMAEELENGQALVKELDNFKVKQDADTGHESYEAWREHEHDDLVLALAIAAWTAENATKQFTFSW